MTTTTNTEPATWRTSEIRLCCASCNTGFTRPRSEHFDLSPDQRRRCPECSAPDRTVTCPGCGVRREVSDELRRTPLERRPVGWRFCQRCTDAGIAPYIEKGIYHEPVRTKPAPLSTWEKPGVVR